VNFRSDNESPVVAEILASIQKANSGTTYAYGDDTISSKMRNLFDDFFETHVSVFPVATGTAANALSIAQLTPTYGSVYCHQLAHLYSEECGAPEFYSGGAKLLPLTGDFAKISTQALKQAMARIGEMGVHENEVSSLSLSQSTELGTVYTVEEITELVQIASSKKLGVHMDGARFANAIYRLGCTPAEATWRSGVDILSFGATKNGAMAAEAVVLFDKKKALKLASLQKRSGHLFSKMRYIAAQFEAYLADDLWLRLAAKANLAADCLAEGLRKCSSLEVLYPVESNEVFVRMPESIANGLTLKGYEFHRWPGSIDTYRFVTSFATEIFEVKTLIKTTSQLSTSN